MDQSKAIKQIWETNQDLWDKKIIPLVLAPLEKSGGLGTTGLWEHILATAFGNSLKTFESIQLLTNHTHPRLLWNNAFILTREHYETFITLEWIAQDVTCRSKIFFDEYSLKLAHFLDLFEKDIEDIRPERRDEIYRERDEVLKRHSRGARTLRLMPTLEERVKALIEPLKIKMPNLFWEYEFYYRDVSGFAHPSGWSIALSLSGSVDTVPVVEPSSRVGYNAVMLNGAWFFRILKCWNRTFRVVSETTVDQWHRQWITESGIVEA